MAQPIITRLGEQKMGDALHIGGSVAIRSVALGDGNGAVYTPDFGAIALKNEIVRRDIKTRSQVSRTTWQITAEFLTIDTPAFLSREVGYFDAAGDLIAILSALDYQPRQIGVTDYIHRHALNFSNVAEGLLIVEAPEDEHFDHVVLALEQHAVLADEQVKQRLLINELLNA